MSKPISINSPKVYTYSEEKEEFEFSTEYKNSLVHISLNFCIVQEPQKPIEPERYRYNESPPPKWLLHKDRKEMKND